MRLPDVTDRLNGHPFFLFGLICLFLSSVSLATRGITPVDETRYLAVAWEMWLRGDFLVPHLNGEPYSHKPPLLFWLIQAGWYFGGVNEWWPRLLQGILSFLNLLLVYRLAGLLWPEQRPVARLAPLLTVTSVLWAFMTTAVMFDMLLTLFALLGLIGIATAWRGRLAFGWSMLGAAIGLGLLAKGPVILLHVLPVGLLAPFCTGGWRAPWRWYGGISLAMLGGAVIALCWAIPAAVRGGEVYADAIFWGQTANRMVDSFAHGHPFWWYLPLLPLLLFPWLLWPAVWRGMRSLLERPWDSGVRFAVAWLLPSFMALSLVSGKQVHYLLPLVPGFMLLAARALLAGPAPAGRLGLPALGLVTIGLGGLWVLATKDLAFVGLPAWAAAGFGALLMLGIALWCIRPADRSAGVGMLSSAALLAFGILHGGLLHAIWPAYDVAPIARAIAGYQRSGIPVVHVGGYHGQFQFAGRLTEPLGMIPEERAQNWVKEHPRGRIVHYFRELPAGAPLPEVVHRFRSRWVGIWRAASLQRRESLEALLSGGRAPARSLGPPDPEPRPTREVVDHVNTTAVAVYNLAHDGKAQSGVLTSRRE